ncbi:unnamed protein product [Rotaria magnacalcarata]|uniref:G-protein coupled receptors family 1 profile domain-containing protein n=2 Tax=Rotaria magnacalcarata TaxID=392030 RepID=A0A816N6Z3_9BILA|nr:unnamed protein product [Rotaria magnacalcarata]
MTSLVFINQMIVIYFGAFIIIVGVFGTVMQAFILMAARYYRKTPSTFYFIVASIHECGIFIAAYLPLVLSVSVLTSRTEVFALWCKLRYFFAISCSAISSSCGCMAAIDQFLITSQNARIRQLSSIKNAYRACFSFAIIWWLHGTLWIYYQEMSPITHSCAYPSDTFFIYAVFFMCIILCGAPCLIMVVFGLLANRNIKKTTCLSRLHIDRQLMIVVFIQVLLTLIGLTPYTGYSAYKTITFYFQKTADQRLMDTLVGNITYMFCSVAYGGRFYIFLYSSSRFRRMVKDRVLSWRRARRIIPLTR